MSDQPQHHDMCDLLSDTAYITRVCTCERAIEFERAVRADELEKVLRRIEGAAHADNCSALSGYRCDCPHGWAHDAARRDGSHE